MTDAQIQAACGEAATLGKRTIVHAQGPEGAKAAVLAGCTAVEHGNRLTDDVIRLMAQHGTYFDSNNHLMIHNYLENKARFLGIGNYTEEGFAYMERGLVSGNESFKRALAAHVNATSAVCEGLALSRVRGHIGSSLTVSSKTCSSFSLS